MADRWATATSTNGKRKILFRYVMHVPAGVDPAEFPNLLVVVWPYSSANDGRMPDGPTNDQQITFEDLVDPALTNSDNAHLVWVRTGEDEKVWWWYSRDINEALEIINQVLADQPRFPIEIEKDSDPDWSAWREFVNEVVKWQN